MSLKRAGHFLAFLLVVGAEKVIGWFPLPVVFRIGSVLGRACGALLPGYKGIVDRNLAIAFGDAMPRAERVRLRRRIFATLGGNLASSVRIAGMSGSELAACVEIDPAFPVPQPEDHPRGRIMAIMHMGCWEVLPRLPEFAQGFSGSAALYQPLANPFLDARLKRMREKAGVTLIDRRGGFAAPLKFLAGGGWIGILVDQHAGDKGQWCPFFGRLASTTNLAALLAARSGARIFPVVLETVAPGRWRLAVDRALDQGDPPDVTAALNLRLETLVNRSPADWFWVHRRWKTPQPNFLLRRYRRGICLPPLMPAADLKKFRILVRSPNWLGDACMAVPAVRAIARGRPDAEVTVLCPENLAPLWKVVDGVDQVLSKPRKGASVWRVGRLVRGHGPFDAGVLLPNSLRSALEMRAGRVPEIFGYGDRWRSRLLTKVVRNRRKPGPVEHHSRFFLRLAAELGADIDDRSLFAPLAARAHPGSAPRLGICSGAEYGPAKRWPAERFAAAANAVMTENPACQATLFGVEGDAGIADTIADSLPEGRFRNLVGKTTLGELMGELSRCSVLLTNDTGTMHLAALLGVPVVAVFGSTDPHWTGPLGSGHAVVRRHVECSPCFLRDCPRDFRCMNDVETESVVARLRERLPASPAVA